MQEKVIEIKQCKNCNTSFEITDKDLEFYEKVSPVFQKPPKLPLSGEGQKDMGNGKVKYLIPTPTLCPECRQQRRLSFRNERKLYKRNCDATGKQIISIFSPDKPYKVYNSEFWWSDKWDAIDYGINFDFSKGFFEQFGDFMIKVPQLSMVHLGCENSDYTTFTLNSKNCYMCSGCNTCENCLYSQFIKGTNIIDSLMLYNSDNCYQGVQSDNCFGCYYFYRSINCSKCIFINNCIGCNNCIDCSNLVNKEYYYKNKFIGKEKFNDLFVNYSKNIYVYDLIKLSKFNIYADIYESENCFGDGIYNSQNCYNCFDVKNAQDSKNLYFCPRAIESQDCTYNAPDGVEYCYEVCSTVGVSSSFSTFHYWYGKNGYYLISCNNCYDCFACIGLRNKSYCIFNKQYTKEEYEEIVPKIIEHMMKSGEWGEFFPSNISPFGYNETVAMEYFPILPPLTPPYEGGGQAQVPPLTRGRLGGGFNWSNYEAPFPNVEKVIKANMLPESISDIPDDILNWAIECEITKKPFRIIKTELEFYRKHNLPIPRRHPDQRHLDRMSLRNPRKLYDRKCDKCGIDMKTTYSLERPEKVYCEKCYEKEVY